MKIQIQMKIQILKKRKHKYKRAGVWCPHPWPCLIGGKDLPRFHSSNFSLLCSTENATALQLTAWFCTVPYTA